MSFSKKVLVALSLTKQYILKLILIHSTEIKRVYAIYNLSFYIISIDLPVPFSPQRRDARIIHYARL